MVRKARRDHQAPIIRTARQTEMVMNQNNNVTTGQAAASSLNSPMRGCRKLNRKMKASVFFLFPTGRRFNSVVCPLGAFDNSILDC